MSIFACFACGVDKKHLPKAMISDDFDWNMYHRLLDIIEDRQNRARERFPLEYDYSNELTALKKAVSNKQLLKIQESLE